MTEEELEKEENALTPKQRTEYNDLIGRSNIAWLWVGTEAKRAAAISKLKQQALAKK